MDAPVAYDIAVWSEGCAAADGLVSLGHIGARVVLLSVSRRECTVERRVECAQLTPLFDQDVADAARAPALSEARPWRSARTRPRRARPSSTALFARSVCCTHSARVR